VVVWARICLRHPELDLPRRRGGEEGALPLGPNVKVMEKPRREMRRDRHHADSVPAVLIRWSSSTLKGPWCRLEGVNRRDDRLKLFVCKNLHCHAPLVRPVRLTGQTGPWLCSAGGTGQTVALHRFDWWAIENLQKQLQAPLDF
jgi:hypothetical protein